MDLDVGRRPDSKSDEFLEVRMAVHELILLLCEIARDKWCSYWEHDPPAPQGIPLAKFRPSVDMSTVVRSKRTSQCRDVPFETKIILAPTRPKQAVAAAAVRLSGWAPACELLGPPSGRRVAAP